MSWLNQEFIYFIISFQWYHRAIAWSLFLYKQMQACWYFNKNIRRSSTEWLSAVAGNENFGYWYYCFSFIFYLSYYIIYYLIFIYLINLWGNSMTYFLRKSCFLWERILFLLILLERSATLCKIDQNVWTQGQSNTKTATVA